MTWYAIHDVDGVLVSTGTVVEELADGLTAVVLSDVDADRLTRLGWRWNPATLTVDIEPPPPTPDPYAVYAAAIEAAQTLQEVRAAGAALRQALEAS